MKPLFFFFFILIYYSVFSQKTAEIDQKEVSLDTILESIEKSYDIKFSYNPEIIKDKHVSISEEHALHKILAQIQLQALIVFEKINDRYYIIKKRNQKRGTLVCGYLFDKNTRKPISDALIHIPDQSDIIISDSNGYFQAYLFNLNDPIEIQYLGYKTKKIITEELQNNNCTKILLSEENFQLDEVVITEYMTSGISKQGANNVININTSKLGVLPRMVDPDILQTLQFVPGVQSPSETASGLHIRGGTPDHQIII